MKKKYKTWIIRTVLLVGTLVSLFFVPWPVLFARLTPLPDTIGEQVSKASSYGFDGIIVYVDVAGKEPQLYSAGYHNRDSKIPADPQALFKIASVGKLYNALAITKLVRSGKLSLDKTLAYYLPDLENRIEKSQQITVRMLVQHRSGIPNYTDTFMYWAQPKQTADENLALVLDLPANFAPGERYQYSNTNYLLLEKIMSSVLGYSSFQYIQEEILIPMNLKRTFGSIHDVNPNDIMSGYYVGHEQDLKTVNVGSMLASAEDLGKFLRALNEGSVFSDNEEQKIYSSVYQYEHSGLIPGYQTIAKYHKDIDAVVIQFTNTVDFEGYNWSLSEVMYDRIIKILKD